MKFATSIFVAAAAASSVLAAPQVADGGHGAPPAATISSTSTEVPAHSASQPAKPAETPAAPAAPAEPDIQIPFSTTNALFVLAPQDEGTWATIEAPGVFNVTAQFAIKNQDKATATFNPPQPFAGIEVYLYQRSDGGVMSMSVDGVAVARLDYYNRTAGPNDPPVKVYQNPHLKRANHVVEFKNLMDPRVHKYGQFNLDHVVITAAADAPRNDAPPPADPPASEPPVDVPPKTNPPLTAPTTTPSLPEESSAQQTEQPGNAAFVVTASKALFSLAGLFVAVLALF